MKYFPLSNEIIKLFFSNQAPRNMIKINMIEFDLKTLILG